MTTIYTGSLKSKLVLAAPDVFDITRGTGGGRGAPFAPSPGILYPALRAHEAGSRGRRPSVVDLHARV